MKLSEITNKNKGTYIAYHLSNSSMHTLEKWMKDKEIPNALHKDKLHVTIVYSRKYLPDFKARGNLSPTPLAKPKEFVIWKNSDDSGEKNANCLIMLLNFPEAEKRHKQIRDEHGATFDYDKYQPHITLSYNIGDMDIKDLEVPKLNLTFDEEYMEDLDLDWAVNHD